MVTSGAGGTLQVEAGIVGLELFRREHSSIAAGAARAIVSLDGRCLKPAQRLGS